MANSRWRKLNQFLAISSIGKQQTGLGAFLADADLDTRENCRVEMDLEIERGAERGCDDRDLTNEPVKRRYRRFRLNYDNPTEQQIFRMIAYKEGAVTAPVGTAADEVQTLTRSGTVSGGAFTLSMTLEGRTGVSRPIPFNASPAQIVAAINDQSKTLGKIIRPGDVVAGGDWTTGITLTFARRLRRSNLPLIAVGGGTLTGGGTIQAAQTQAGGNYFHQAQRSADGSKPHFTFALGDESGTTATAKYGDAVVDSIELGANSDGATATMTVTILCRFLAELVTDFDVPACVKKPAVKGEDVRIVIGGGYENRDLVSHQIALNDNVPAAAAFAFDDIDVTEAFVCGRQPSQLFTTEIFGDSNHRLHALAMNEFIEGNETDFVTHFGNPGGRVSVIGDDTKIKPQAQLEGFSGEAEQSTIKFTGTPYGVAGVPVRYEAYLDQSVPFLTT